MRICYDTILGKLAITVVESPFFLSAEIDGADGNAWKSPKYTALSMKHWKLTDQKVDDGRAAFIWAAAHNQPKIGVTAGRIVLTITPGLDLPLTKRVKKEMLDGIVEVDEPKDGGKLASMDPLWESAERGCHKRHFADIESIDILRAENAILKEEIARLRQLAARAGYPASVISGQQNVVRGG